MKLEDLLKWQPQRVPFIARQSHPLHRPYIESVHDWWKSLIPSLPSAAANEEMLDAMMVGFPADTVHLVKAIIRHESNFQSVCFINMFPDHRKEGITQRFPAPGRAKTTLDNGLGLSQITTGFYNSRLSGRYGSYITYPHYALAIPQFAAHLTVLSVFELLEKKGDALGALFAWAGSSQKYPTKESYATKPGGLYEYYNREKGLRA